jgi:ribosome maturation factor RimP
VQHDDGASTGGLMGTLMPLLQAVGVELVDVSVRPNLVRLSVDRDDGLDLELLAKLSTAISVALDEDPSAPSGRYELEVSSPGLDRPLRRPEHFIRAVGQVVALRVSSPGVASRLEGCLVAADETGIVLRPTGLPRPTEAASAVSVALVDEDDQVRIGYGDIARAHVVFDWRAALTNAPPAVTRADRRRARHRPAVASGGRRTGASTQRSPSFQTDAVESAESGVRSR